MRAVLADANLLFSRVLRDYFVYGAVEGLVDLRWSEEILDEVGRNLVLKNGFTKAQAERLRDGLTAFLPQAMVVPADDDYAAFSAVPMKDPDDRHVLAAAVAARADYLCTDNIEDFPEEAARVAGVRVVSPDAFLCLMAESRPHLIVQTHRSVVRSRPGLDDTAVLDRLGVAGARTAATAIADLLER
ncbi:PIN domain-containing protein [Brevibacterium litoralis]|uniref:PIN domain-containing protein n=1 Tax=Brevibacterium litoralis TaxID=3138935 RepID=UPI0032EE01B8